MTLVLNLNSEEIKEVIADRFEVLPQEVVIEVNNYDMSVSALVYGTKPFAEEGNKLTVSKWKPKRKEEH